MDVSFRRLAGADLPMLHEWLNEPGVVQWWEGDDVSWEAVVRDYDPHADDTTEHWIALLDDRPIGWLQCYPAAHEPDECALWLPLGIDRAAAGIDYLVADPADRGRGVGTAIISAFVREVVFGLHPDWTQACASPFVANEASWRALERAGGHFVGIIDDGTGPCRLVTFDRKSLPRG